MVLLVKANYVDKQKYIYSPAVYLKKILFVYKLWVYLCVCFAAMSVFSYFTSELTRGYLLEREEEKYAQKRQRVYTFMKTPRELEKVLTEFHFV